MAKKTPTIGDAASDFINVIARCQFTTLKRENRTLYSKNPKRKNSGTLFMIDQGLWDEICKNEEFMKNVSELNPSDMNDRFVIDRLIFTHDMENGWIDIDNDEMANLDRIYITLDGFDYKIEINKTIWPMRFKKAEYVNFSYKIFTKPFNAFAIRKRFEGPVEDSSFYIMRVFQII